MKHVSLVLLLVVLAPAIATAQPAPPPDVEALSRVRFERGAKLFSEKNYIAALGEFAAGYELGKRPLFLFNMGECARLVGDVEGARAYYQRYLASEPSGQHATLVKQRLEQLAAANRPAAGPPPGPSATARPAGPPPATATTPTTASTSTTPPAPTTTAAITTDPGAASRPLPQDDRRAPAWLPPTATLVAAGVGVVSLALSGAFSLRARSKWSDAKSHCNASLACDPDGVELADQATTAADGATATLIIGLAAIAAGGGYWLYDRYRAKHRLGHAVVPTATPHGAGLAVVGAF